MKTATYAAVFCASLLFLGARAGDAGIGTGWVDPVSRIQAQDEAVYAESVQTMVERGDWLTPYFMDRYALYKPPMLYWLSAAAVRAWGPSRTALRAPSLIAGALTVTLVFAWVGSAAGLAAALTAAILLASSHLFFSLSRMALTDALLVSQVVTALFVLSRDPVLARRSSLWLFAAACGTAVLTKAAAGLLPVLAAALFWAASGTRPAHARIAALIAIFSAIVLPWHLYQLWAHPRWFWTEYVLQEHLTWGLAPPAQTSTGSHAVFYGIRLALLDPVLLLAGGTALLIAGKGVPGAWFAATAADLFAFQYRNAAYLLPLLPALAILAGLAIPRRFARAALLAAAAVACFKAAAPGQPWGLPFAPEVRNASHQALDQYASLHRGKDLIIVEPDDQFYATLLHLPRVRYAYIGNLAPTPPTAMDFQYLGISVTAGDFGRVGQLLPVYEQRLRSFDLPSAEPVATAIWADDENQLAALIATHPGSDFFVPARLAPLGQSSHHLRIEGGRAFLLAR